MKILAVGGAGYIGSHVVRNLLDRGHNVAVFDNLSTGYRENLTSDTQLIVGDILNVDQIKQALKEGFDAVFHFAALKAANESMVIPEKYSIHNLCGTVNLINASTEAGVKYFVFSSSAAVYGEPKFLPMNEEHPVNPENYYGFTKLEIERILQWYDRLKGIRFASLRYFNAAGYDIYGRIKGLERNPQNLIPIIMEVAIGVREKLSIYGNDYETADGTCIRDYVHVNDLADGHSKALDYISKKNSSLIVNLGSELGISVKSVVEKAREITGEAIPALIAPRRLGDPAKVVASSEKAYSTLGWKARYSDVSTLLSTTWNIYKGLKKHS